VNVKKIFRSRKVWKTEYRKCVIFRTVVRHAGSQEFKSRYIGPALLAVRAATSALRSSRYNASPLQSIAVIPQGDLSFIFAVVESRSQ
jgi:hypothetical protein